MEYILAVHAGILKKFRQKGESNAKTIKKICGIGLALAMCTTGINYGLKIVSGNNGDKLTVNASVTASGNETDDFKAENVNDGNIETRWSSASIENNDQWIQLKFDEPVTFNNIKLYWETSAGKEYKIQTSDDGQVWNDLISVTDGQKGETRAFGFRPVTAQYVRVYVTENYPDVWNCVSIY